MAIFWLTLTSSAAWFISTLAGGGSPLILIPALSYFIEVAAIPPVITIGMLFGNLQRVYLYWQEIDWEITSWYLPGAIAGAVLGALVFIQVQLKWLPLLLGVFLVLSAASYGLKGEKTAFQVRAWHFLPGGFIYAFLSGLVGSTGPLLNSFYLNYGLVKEQMVATKSVNVVVVHIAKLISYALFGALTSYHFSYGLIVGLAALPGNWLGQFALNRISEQQFRKLVVAFITFSGLLILWQQRQLLAF